MAVGIDTMILIWAWSHASHAPKQKATQNTEEMQRRSRILLHELEQDGQSIVVPHITVSEWLRGVKSEDHGKFLEELDAQFELMPFDLPSAAMAARIHREIEADLKPKDKEAATKGTTTRNRERLLPAIRLSCQLARSRVRRCD